MSEAAATKGDRGLIQFAAAHGYLWLFAANVVGVWLAFLLLHPGAGKWLGEWSYGRWMIVHLNWQLYGWTSLPLVAWLMRVYAVEHNGLGAFGRAAVWIWSLALVIGACNWLRGGSSGKLFLDWSGYAGVYFPLAIFFLWLVLAAGLVSQFKNNEGGSVLARSFKHLGLLCLLPVPAVLYLASGPTVYPPINPGTGGPTGASQLESSLAIVLILLLLPLALLPRNKSIWFQLCWILLPLHGFFCVLMGRDDVSHHMPLQYLGFASLVFWAPLVALYFRAFRWPPETLRWRRATLVWWILLVLVGLAQYLPGILDHYKFTDGLVAHSLMAMAGFTTSLLVLLTILLLGQGKVTLWLNRRITFWLWHGGTAAYILLMLVAGWIEGSSPGFTFLPGTLRNLIYLLRFCSGLAMTVASADWLLAFMPPWTARDYADAAVKEEKK